MFDVDFSAFLLPRGDERGVLSLFVGVIERPAGLHGLCSGFRSFPFESVFVAKGEFARVEGKLAVVEDEFRHGCQKGRIHGQNIHK